MSKAPLPRRLEILRETFNADIRAAARDGFSPAELIALAGAVTEDLLMAVPQKYRGIGVELVLEKLPKKIASRTAAGE
jgi:hypothetical protein